MSEDDVVQSTTQWSVDVKDRRNGQAKIIDDGVHSARGTRDAGEEWKRPKLLECVG